MRHLLAHAAPLALLVLAGQALGQFVPPVPAPPTPTAPYEAPAKPAAAPVPPPPPAELDVAPITLIERDSDGKIKPLTVLPEEAAAQKLYETLKPEQQERFRKVTAERAAKMEQQLAAHAPAAVEVFVRQGELVSSADFAALRDLGDKKVRTLMVTPGLLANLQAQQVVNFKQSQVADKAAKDYTKAFNKEVRGGSDASPTMVVDTMRAVIRGNTIEPMRSMRAMLLRAAPQWNSFKAGFQMSPETTAAVAAAEKGLTDAGTDDQKVAAMAELLKVLTDDQKSAVLSAVATPVAETKPAPAAAPATTAPAGDSKPVIDPNTPEGQ